MFKNGLYNLFGTVARLALSIVSVPLLLQFMGPSDYGLYAILMAITNIAVLSEWSICMVLIVYVAQATTKSENTLIGNTLLQAMVLVVGLATITAALLWVLSPWMALAFPNLSQSNRTILQQGCQLSAIVVLLRLLQQYFIGIEQSHGHYKLLNSINTAFSICQTTLILAFSYWQKSLLIIIGVQAFTTAVFLIIHGLYCYKYNWLSPLRYAEKNKWDQFPRMMMYGGRTFIGGIGSAFFSQGDRLIVGRLLGLDASGFYSAITSVTTQIHTLSTISIQPLVSTLTKLVESGDSLMNQNSLTRESLQTTVSRALSINVILAVSLGGFIVMMAPEISSFVFKHKFLGLVNTSNTLKITALIYTLYSLNAVGYYMLLSIKREIITTVVSLICGLLSLIIIGVLSHFYGVIGALYGNAGYLLTLYLLIDGFRSFRLRWSLWYKATWQSLFIFALIVAMSIIVESTISRFIVLCILLSVACIPLLKEGWQYIIVNRRNRSV